MEDWAHNLWKRRKRFTPNDTLTYNIHPAVIEFTVGILRDYGRRESEGLVYWAGRNEDPTLNISAAVAPRTKATRYGFQTSHDENEKFVEFICGNDLQYLAQVHSHPSSWVDHSHVDDTQTAFRCEGLISVVVPYFGEAGMTPIQKCGVHRYHDSRFIRLSNRYLTCHFRLATDPLIQPILNDFRYG